MVYLGPTEKHQCPDELPVWDECGNGPTYLRCILTEGHGRPPLNLRAHLTKVDGQLVRWGCGIQDGMKT